MTFRFPFDYGFSNRKKSRLRFWFPQMLLIFLNRLLSDPISPVVGSRHLSRAEKRREKEQKPEIIIKPTNPTSLNIASTASCITKRSDGINWIYGNKLGHKNESNLCKLIFCCLPRYSRAPLCHFKDEIYWLRSRAIRFAVATMIGDFLLAHYQ